jgi:undecaprenyl-diphosphatase
MPNALAASLDHSIVRSLNDWFAGSSARRSLDRGLTVWPLVAILALVVAVWLLDWGRAPERRAFLVLGLGGAGLGLLANTIQQKSIYRARPFVVMQVHHIVSHGRDSSLWSDHLTVAGAFAAALLANRRWAGIAAVVLTVALAIGRVGAAVHYPSDVAIGAAVGAAGFLILLPLRRFVVVPLKWLERVEGRIYARR